MSESAFHRRGYRDPGGQGGRLRRAGPLPRGGLPQVGAAPARRGRGGGGPRAPGAIHLRGDRGVRGKGGRRRARSKACPSTARWRASSAWGRTGDTSPRTTPGWTPAAPRGSRACRRRPGRRSCARPAVRRASTTAPRSCGGRTSGPTRGAASARSCSRAATRHAAVRPGRRARLHRHELPALFRFRGQQGRRLGRALCRRFGVDPSLLPRIVALPRRGRGDHRRDVRGMRASRRDAGGGGVRRHRGELPFLRRHARRGSAWTWRAPPRCSRPPRRSSGPMRRPWC